MIHNSERSKTFEPDAPEIPSAILDAATEAIWDCSINFSLGLDGANARLVAQAILEAAGMAEFLVKDHHKTREINLLTAENRAQTARIAELEAELAEFQTNRFHPDWPLLEATQGSLRESWARIRELESEIETIARIGADDVPSSTVALKRLQKLLCPVTTAGARMSNAAYNLKQRDDLPEKVRQILDECQAEWDAAMRQIPKSWQV